MFFIEDNICNPEELQKKVKSIIFATRKNYNIKVKSIIFATRKYFLERVNFRSKDEGMNLSIS